MAFALFFPDAAPQDLPGPVAGQARPKMDFARRGCRAKSLSPEG
jgi:hypothetical protein